MRSTPVAVLVLICCSLSPVRKTVVFTGFIPHENHTRVFRYVSSVDNFQALNPTILDITRRSKVNATNFYLEYSERLSQLPWVENRGRALYGVRNPEPWSTEHHLVSRHETCFVADIFCLATDSVLTIGKSAAANAYYREQINYSCPWVLSSFCYEEIARQRRSILDNLKQVFSSFKSV